MKHKPEILPYFPLSVFLFPGEDIPLRIFEPRYLQLIDEVRSSGSTFVIPFVINNEVQEFGCEVGLKSVVAENPGGRMVITVESISVVQILNFKKQLEGKLYPGGAILRISCSETIKSQELKKLIRHYTDKFDNSFLSGSDSAHITRQDLVKALNLASDDKFKFVSMEDGSQKEGYLAGQLRYLNMIREQETQLGNDFGLN
jgi:hypothetical protein